MNTPPRMRGRFLENGPHTVKVTTMKAEETRTGRKYVPDKTYIIDKVLVQPTAGNASKASEQRTAWKSLVENSTLRIIGTGRKWPGGSHSLVEILVGPDEYVGETFQQSGVATVYAASAMTKHFAVRVDALNGEVR